MGHSKFYVMHGKCISGSMDDALNGKKLHLVSAEGLICKMMTRREMVERLNNDVEIVEEFLLSSKCIKCQWWQDEC